MERHMAKIIVHPEHWPELSKNTMDFIEHDEYADRLFEMMYSAGWRAIDWYEYAEKDSEIARWVPDDGDGDCFLVLPGDMAANEFQGMYDALTLYAEVKGRTDVSDELNVMSLFFTCIDRTEA